MDATTFSIWKLWIILYKTSKNVRKDSKGRYGVRHFSSSVIVPTYILGWYRFTDPQQDVKLITFKDKTYEGDKIGLLKIVDGDYREGKGSKG